MSEEIARLYYVGDGSYVAGYPTTTIEVAPDEADRLRETGLYKGAGNLSAAEEQARAVADRPADDPAPEPEPASEPQAGLEPPVAATVDSGPPAEEQTVSPGRPSKPSDAQPADAGQEGAAE